MLMSSLLYSPAAPFLLGSSAQTFTPALEGALGFESAWFPSSPRVLWGGWVTAFLVKLQLCKSHFFSES